MAVSAATSERRPAAAIFLIPRSLLRASFHHQLSESETRWVGSIVLDLFDRTNDEDNNINWALGDWCVKADDWFGLGTGEKWAAEYAELKTVRDFLLRLTGGTLMALQSLEKMGLWGFVWAGPFQATQTSIIGIY